MQFSLSITSVVSAILQMASAIPTLLSPQKCGTFMPSSSSIEARSLQDSPPHLTARNNPQINVYFHVMACGTDPTDGNIPQTKIDATFSHLQTVYGVYGIDFTYVSTQRYYYQGYCSASSPYAVESVKRLGNLGETTRLGTYADLNIWIMELYNNFGYGIATPPYANPDQDQFNYDGVVVGRDTLVGDAGFHGEGDTLIHEVGHWLYLYHVFEGGCDAVNGDLVSDTPPQSWDAYYQNTCPTGTPDSCPDLPGTDPIHNYMNYVADSCMYEFTPGQVARMKSAWATYREGK